VSVIVMCLENPLCECTRAFVAHIKGYFEVNLGIQCLNSSTYECLDTSTYEYQDSSTYECLDTSILQLTWMFGYPTLTLSFMKVWTLSVMNVFTPRYV